MKKNKWLWLWVFIPLLALTISLILEKITDTTFVSISGIWLIVFFLYMVDLETISEIKIGVTSIKRDVQAAKEIREEIEGILESIKSQKEMIDVIARDANTAKAKEKAREEKELSKKLRRLSTTGYEEF